MKNNIVKPSYLYRYMEDRSLLNGIYSYKNKVCYYDDDDTSGQKGCSLISMHSIKTISSEEQIVTLVVDDSSYYYSPVNVSFVDPQCDWIEFYEGTKKKGSKFIQKLKIKDNQGSERRAEITVYQNDETSPCRGKIRFTIVQNSISESCLLTPLSNVYLYFDYFEYENNSIRFKSSYFNQTVNINYSIIPNGASNWVYVKEPVYGSNNIIELGFDISENDGKHDRECDLVITQNGKTPSGLCGCETKLVYHITQYNKGNNCILNSISKTNIYCDYNENTRNIEFISENNGEPNKFAVTVSDESKNWVHIIGGSINGSSVSKEILISSNEEYNDRKGKVIVEQIDPCSKRIIYNIYQNGKGSNCMFINVDDEHNSDGFNLSSGDTSEHSISLKSSYGDDFVPVSFMASDRWITLSYSEIDKKYGVISQHFYLDKNLYNVRDGYILAKQVGACDGVLKVPIKQYGGLDNNCRIGSSSNDTLLSHSRHDELYFIIEYSENNGNFVDIEKPILSDESNKWISIDSYNRIGNSNGIKVIYSVLENKSDDMRRGEIEIFQKSPCGNKFTYTIKQNGVSEGSDDCLFECGITSFNLDKDENTINVIVNNSSYNDNPIPVSFEESCDWISGYGEVKEIGSFGFMQSFKVEGFDGIKRNCDISIKQIGENKCSENVIKVNVSQTGTKAGCLLIIDFDTIIISPNKERCVLDIENDTIVIKPVGNCILRADELSYKYIVADECILNADNLTYDVYPIDDCVLIASKLNYEYIVADECILNADNLIYDIYQDNNCVLRADKLEYEYMVLDDCILKANKLSYDMISKIDCVLNADKLIYDI